MAKMWAGRTAGETSKMADDFNSSLPFDCRMFRQDIRGSMAHAAMLGATGILSRQEADALIDGLSGILSDLENGKLPFDFSCEDIHMFVEQELTARLGDLGKKLHTARSRNDQVALDLRLWLREETAKITDSIRALIEALIGKADENTDTVMPGYTHLQRAQPITFGHYLMAYVQMLFRDIGRFRDMTARADVSPIGCCALAGTTYPTDRKYEAARLSFGAVCANSLDGVSDRDFCLEFLSCTAILMMHLSRLCEELVLFSSWEFRFIECDDAFTTGSSIMPQKKNPDMAELVRGKTGRVYGDLVALLTVMKGLPLAYNKDMQEDKESVFDAADTATKCLAVLAPMIATLKVHPEEMLRAAGEGFINATDLADYLVGKGLPFRTAYKLSGQLVSDCIQRKTVLEKLPLSVYQSYSPLFDEDLYEAVSLSACVSRRRSEGGTCKESVQQQIKEAKKLLETV